MNFLSLINSRHRDLVETDFVSLWETTGASETIQLPITNLYTIDWGDGNITTTETSHEYLVADQYTIRSPDAITDFAFANVGDKDKILNISNFGGLIPIMDSFRGCSFLDITATDLAELVGSIINLFRDNDNLIWNSSVTTIDTSVVSSTNFMFGYCGNFNQALTWDCLTNSNVINMFFNCSSLDSPLTFTNTSLLTSFSQFLYGCTSFNSALTFDDTSNVTNMFRMFYNNTLYNQVTFLDISNVSNMNSMYYNCDAFDQDISSRDYSSVTNIADFMTGKTAADYTATNYDALLQKWDNVTGGLIFANMANVNIGMGTIKRTAAGSTAHASLISKGFVITDGGI